MKVISKMPPCPSLRWFGLRMLGIQAACIGMGVMIVSPVSDFGVVLYLLLFAFPFGDVAVSTYRAWRAYWRGGRTP